MNGFAEFDPKAPLPAGTTVLEASAGTGKTHAVAALAVRLIADGETTIDRLLMVTFGRNATRELRSRVRDHLLRAADDTEPGPPRQRLTAAVAGFDAARVMTIHEFCAAMYAELGILAAADPSGGVIADLRPLIREVAHDLYLNRYAFDARQPPFPLGDDRRNGVTGAVSLADDAVRYALRPSMCAVIGWVSSWNVITRMTVESTPHVGTRSTIATSTAASPSTCGLVAACSRVSTSGKRTMPMPAAIERKALRSTSTPTAMSAALSPPLMRHPASP